MHGSSERYVNGLTREIKFCQRVLTLFTLESLGVSPFRFAKILCILKSTTVRTNSISLPWNENTSTRYVIRCFGKIVFVNVVRFTLRIDIINLSLKIKLFLDRKKMLQIYKRLAKKITYLHMYVVAID